MLKQKDLKRATLIEACIKGQCTIKQVANTLGISERRVKQIKKEVKENDVKSIQHGNRGRKPKNTIPDETKNKILELRRSYQYELSNFKHFQELLKERENIDISYSALYNILHNVGIKSPKKHHKTKLHHRRKRKKCEGMMLQADATPFDWFENGNRYSLHGFIDDATGKITGLYMCKNEYLLGYLEVLRQTLENYGIPISLYPDKYSVFLKLPKRYNLDELLCVKFERTIDNAGVFSINNRKFQIIDRSLPPKTKVSIYLSPKIGMVVKVNKKVYDLQPLDLISKGKIDKNSLDYHQWLPDVVLELINEFYLKDAKAS